MAEMQMMEFPKTVDEFMESYKIVDTEQVYTNGSELVPIFRMRQWFEHLNGAEWISVKERLPEHSGPYLVWMLWPDDEEPNYSIINFDADCGEFGDWNEYFDPVSLGWAGSDFQKIEDVVAWMPLPEPPEEGGGEDG